MEKVELSFKRTEELAKQKLVSQEVFDNIKLELDVARNALQIAGNNLERTQSALQTVEDDSIERREAAVERFQDAGGLIVCATRVAGQGITLTRASNVVFLDLEWTPAMHDQAEDRLHRIGQEESVTAWYLLAAQTIDETMIELISRKRGIVGAVTDGRANDSEQLIQSVVRELRETRPRRRLRPVA